MVASGTLRWAEQLGLIPDDAARRRLERTDVARLGAAVYHDGYDEAALQLATDFMTWLYMHDDLWVDGVRRDLGDLDRDHDRLIEIVSGEPVRPDDHPLCQALDDIRRRLAAYGSELGWFDATVEQYISTKSWEARNQLEREVPDVRTYIQMRAYGGGVDACFELGVLVRPIGLTRRLRNHAYVRSLALMANNMVCWANDIVSLDKELNEGCTTNLVIALQREKNLSWPDALAWAVARWNAEMMSFDMLVPRLRALAIFTTEERAALNAYVGLLGAWVRGNLDYDYVVCRFDVDAVKAAG